MLLLDGEHSAGFLSDLGVKIEDINFFEGKSCSSVVCCDPKCQQDNKVKVMK